MTWYFRTIEPRRGRVFAELKKKHIETFPLPQDVEQEAPCRDLNRLGAERFKLAEAAAQDNDPDERAQFERRRQELDQEIEAAVRSIFCLTVGADGDYAAGARSRRSTLASPWPQLLDRPEQHAAKLQEVAFDRAGGAERDLLLAGGE